MPTFLQVTDVKYDEIHNSNFAGPLIFSNQRTYLVGVVFFEVGDKPWLLRLPKLQETLHILLENFGIALCHKHPQMLVDLRFVGIILNQGM